MSMYMDKIKINSKSLINSVHSKISLFYAFYVSVHFFFLYSFSALFLSFLVSIDGSILQRIFNFLYCLRAILQSVLNQGLEEIHTFSFFFSYNRVSCTNSFFCSGHTHVSLFINTVINFRLCYILFV